MDSDERMKRINKVKANRLYDSIRYVFGFLFRTISVVWAIYPLCLWHSTIVACGSGTDDLSEEAFAVFFLSDSVLLALLSITSLPLRTMLSRLMPNRSLAFRGLTSAFAKSLTCNTTNALIAYSRLSMPLLRSLETSASPNIETSPQQKLQQKERKQRTLNLWKRLYFDRFHSRTDTVVTPKEIISHIRQQISHEQNEVLKYLNAELQKFNSDFPGICFKRQPQHRALFGKTERHIIACGLVKHLRDAGWVVKSFNIRQASETERGQRVEVLSYVIEIHWPNDMSLECGSAC